MAHGHFSRSLVLAVAASVAGACAIPNTIETLDDVCPPPEFGRPAWVRVCAGTGAWIGGLCGGVVSIVLLPVTYPVSLIAGDGLGEQSASEFLFFPALGGAALGHSLLGTPPDVVDYLFRRLWVGIDDPIATYDFVPMPGPAIPQPQPQPEPTQDAGVR